MSTDGPVGPDGRPPPGRFIVLEGGDGCGKTTQAARLAARLREEGSAVVETFEPGATALGARIRDLVLGDVGGPVDERAETLLLAADRAQHVAEVIRPALDRGAVVVGDRYVPSSLVYQGVARRLGTDGVEALNRWATGGVEPDVVIVLDVDDATAAARAAREPDRIERAGDGFHAEVRAAYRRLATEHGWVVVDGGPAPDEVAAAVWEAVTGLRSPPGEGGPG